MKHYASVLVALVTVTGSAIAQTGYTNHLDFEIQQRQRAEMYRVAFQKGEAKHAEVQVPAAKVPLVYITNDSDLKAMVAELSENEKNIVTIKVGTKPQSKDQNPTYAVYMQNQSLPSEVDFQSQDGVTIISRSEGFAKMLNAIESQNSQLTSVEVVFKGEVATHTYRIAIQTEAEKLAAKAQKEAQRERAESWISKRFGQRVE